MLKRQEEQSNQFYNGQKSRNQTYFLYLSFKMYLQSNLNHDIFIFGDNLPSVHPISLLACGSDISLLVLAFLGFHISCRMLTADHFCSLLILDKIKLKK